MTLKTYYGSCHCGAVQFQAEIDLSQGTGKCNCTSCLKRRWWSVTVKPEAFRATGEDKLSCNVEGGRERTSFCTICGVSPFVRVPAAEWNDGESVSISVAALDDASPEDIADAPVHYMDGFHDNWWNPPAFTRHL